MANDRPAGGRADRDDPFLRALFQDLRRVVRPQVAEAQAGRLGHPKTRVEEELVAAGSDLVTLDELVGA